jgi:hypothetical protein
MTVDMTAIVEEAVVERASGSQVSRPKSLLAAAVAGVAIATLTYKILRSGVDSAEEK